VQQFSPRQLCAECSLDYARGSIPPKKPSNLVATVRRLQDQSTLIQSKQPSHHRASIECLDSCRCSILLHSYLHLSNISLCPVPDPRALFQLYTFCFEFDTRAQASKRALDYNRGVPPRFVIAAE
jgi:hypothetical protein